MAAYAFILSSLFCPSLTGFAVRVGEECKAMAEMTPNSCVTTQSLYFDDTKFASRSSVEQPGSHQ